MGARVYGAGPLHDTTEMSTTGTKFVVMARDEQGRDYVETIRTVEKAAQEDVDLIKATTGRTAWVVEDRRHDNG